LSLKNKALGLKIDIVKAVALSGYEGKFRDSLKSVLKYMEKDPNIDSIKKGAYLLATAKIEADYSLQRWEADYTCKLQGLPYQDKPCETALNYYRSTDGKKNYYTLGTDSRGLPYFGRGLIQLTGKANYETYGKLIGLDLVKNPELALQPDTSYNIATTYMANRTYGGKNTFQWVELGNLTNARKTINASSKDLDKIQKSYDLWLNILGQTAKVVSSTTDGTKKKIISIGAVILSVMVTVSVYVLVTNFKAFKK
jgi:predicted chitinase